MHLMRYLANGAFGLAASSDGTKWRGLLAGHSLYPGEVDTLLAAGADALADAAQKLLAHGGAIDLDAVNVLKPVAQPGKVLCLGLNYRDHIAELGLDVPSHLTVFTRYSQSLVAHGERLIHPQATSQFDYEGELAAIIGRPGRRIPRDEALSHVSGYTIVNDGSLRDLQNRSGQWTLGKNADASGSMGPWLTLAEALPQCGQPLRLVTRLNSQVVQDGTTGDLVFDVAQAIETMSEVMTLLPGDVIATGTPAGVAAGSVEPRWLEAGDEVEVEVEGIGVLRNPVVAERF